MQDCILLLLPMESCNILPNNLFKELFNLDLLDFPKFLDFSNVKSM